MIKKIAMLCAVFMLAAVSCALADSAPEPRWAEGEIIDVQIQTDKTEVSIGDDITIDITITNLTKNRLSLYEVYINIINFDTINSTVLNSQLDTLNPYESVTITLTDEVKADNDWYAIGDGFYGDLNVFVHFRVDDDALYYEGYIFDTPIKIPNLYDGSEYINLEWLDDRDTMYVYKTYYYDYEDYGYEKYYGQAIAYFRAQIENNSPVLLKKWIYDIELEPGQKVILNNDFINWRMPMEEIHDSEEWRIDFVLKIEDKYYYYKKTRTYNVEVLERPDAQMQFSCTVANDEKTDVYKLDVKNSEDEKIEDFCIMMRSDVINNKSNKCFEVFDIEQGETATVEFPDTAKLGIDEIYIGRIIDGMAFLWLVDYSKQYSDYETLNKAQYHDSYYYNFDYVYYLKQQNSINVTPTLMITETPTATPTAVPTATPKPTRNITPLPIAQPTPQVTITRRSNPYVWALIAIGLLICGAVAAIVLSMKKNIKKKDKQNEGSDD